MGLRHKRNLTAWLQNWVASVESFTPTLRDEIIPVVLVDDMRGKAPLYGATDRLIAFSRAPQSPIPVLGSHAAYRIRVRGNGLRIKDLHNLGGGGDWLLTFTDNLALSFSNRVPFVPLQMSQPGRRTTEVMDSVFEHGGYLPVNLSGDEVTIEIGANPSLQRNLWGSEGLPVPPGLDVYMIRSTIDLAFDMNMWVEEVPIR